MLIVCPSCASATLASDAVLGSEGGRLVRCRRCAANFLADPPDPFADAVAAIEAAADAIAPPRALAPESVEPVAPRPMVEIEGEVVDPSPPLIEEPSPPPVPALPADLTPLAAPAPRALHPKPRPAPLRRPAGRSLPRLQAGASKTGASKAVLALSLAALALVAARAPIAAASPLLARLYATIGLGPPPPFVVARVTSQIEGIDGGEALVVEGELVNRGPAAATAPRILAVVRDERGVELYAWPAQSLKLALEPGERVLFRARLAAPPANGRTVRIRLSNEPRDAQPPRNS